MIKIRVIFMVLAISTIFSAIALGAPKAHKGKVEKKADKDPPVVILDMSGPDKPESEFPDVVNKGKL